MVQRLLEGHLRLHVYLRGPRREESRNSRDDLFVVLRSGEVSLLLLGQGRVHLDEVGQGVPELRVHRVGPTTAGSPTSLSRVLDGQDLVPHFSPKVVLELGLNLALFVWALAPVAHPTLFGPRTPAREAGLRVEEALACSNDDTLCRDQILQGFDGLQLQGRIGCRPHRGRRNPLVIRTDKAGDLLAVGDSGADDALRDGLIMGPIRSRNAEEQLMPVALDGFVEEPRLVLIGPLGEAHPGSCDRVTDHLVEAAQRELVLHGNTCSLLALLVLQPLPGLLPPRSDGPATAESLLGKPLSAESLVDALEIGAFLREGDRQGPTQSRGVDPCGGQEVTSPNSVPRPDDLEAALVRVAHVGQVLLRGEDEGQTGLTTSVGIVPVDLNAEEARSDPTDVLSLSEVGREVELLPGTEDRGAVLALPDNRRVPVEDLRRVDAQEPGPLEVNDVRPLQEHLCFSHRDRLRPWREVALLGSDSSQNPVSVEQEDPDRHRPSELLRSLRLLLRLPPIRWGVPGLAVGLRELRHVVLGPDEARGTTLPARDLPSQRDVLSRPHVLAHRDDGFLGPGQVAQVDPLVDSRRLGDVQDEGDGLQGIFEVFVRGLIVGRPGHRPEVLQGETVLGKLCLDLLPRGCWLARSQLLHDVDVDPRPLLQERVVPEEPVLRTPVGVFVREEPVLALSVQVPLLRLRKNLLPESCRLPLARLEGVRLAGCASLSDPDSRGRDVLLVIVPLNDQLVDAGEGRRVQRMPCLSPSCDQAVRHVTKCRS